LLRRHGQVHRPHLVQPEGAGRGIFGGIAAGRGEKGRTDQHGQYRDQQSGTHSDLLVEDETSFIADRVDLAEGAVRMELADGADQAAGRIAVPGTTRPSFRARFWPAPARTSPRHVSWPRPALRPWSWGDRPACPADAGPATFP